MAVENIGSGQASAGISFLVSAGIVYEIIAACCSSPQTTEINAGARSSTLMKWVHMGMLQSAVFVGAAIMFDRKNKVPIITGGVLAAGVMYLSYAHANKAGLEAQAQGLPGTETYARGA